MFKRSAYSLIATLLVSLITIDRLGRANVPSEGPKIPPKSSTAPRKAPDGKGAGCAVCPSAQGEVTPIYAGSYARSGGHAANYPFKPASRSLFEGFPVNLVNTANGSLSFTVNDIELHNALTAIAFSRVYASDRETDYGLGKGWSFLFDDRIKLKKDGAIMTSGAGSIISFRRNGHGSFILDIPEPGPHQSFEVTDSGEVIEAVNGLSRTYSKIGKEYRLRRIADRDGNNIDISYDKRGRLDSIAGVGIRIELSWSGGERSQLLSVADSTGRRVSFIQSHRLLQSVTDATGARWTYECWDVEFECCCPETDPECSFCGGGGGGGGDGGGGDGGGGGDSDQCARCLATERMACKNNWDGCMSAALAASIAAAAGAAAEALEPCTLWVGVFGPEAIAACVAAAAAAAGGAALYLGKQACDSIYNGCLITSRNRCSACT